MKRFELRVDPLTNEIYYDVHLAGRALLQDPLLNKGHAFPHDERAEFELLGLMPDSVEVEDQAFISGGVVVHQFSKIGRLAMVEFAGPAHERQQRLAAARALEYNDLSADRQTVHVAVGEIIFDDGPARTVAGRKTRFRVLLSREMAAAGWARSGPLIFTCAQADAGQ